MAQDPWGRVVVSVVTEERDVVGWAASRQVQGVNAYVPPAAGGCRINAACRAQASAARSAAQP
jgi:hypothetical protein